MTLKVCSSETYSLQITELVRDENFPLENDFNEGYNLCAEFFFSKCDDFVFNMFNIWKKHFWLITCTYIKSARRKDVKKIICLFIIQRIKRIQNTDCTYSIEGARVMNKILNLSDNKKKCFINCIISYSDRKLLKKNIILI